MQLIKYKYLTEKKLITVDSDGDNALKVDLRGKATVTVLAKPANAHIYINGTFAGEGDIDGYPVESGEVAIHIEAPEYVLFKTTETIEAGKTKTIEKELDYLFGSLEVKSNPDKVSILLNNTKVGMTPYTVSHLRVGSYTLTLLEENYEKVVEDVTIPSGTTLKKDYNLKFSKAYRDSLRRERWLAHGARGLRRVIFGLVSAGCGATGYYFDTKYRGNIEQCAYWEDKYDSLKDPNTKRFKEIKENYYMEYDQAENNRSTRDIFLSIAGACGLGLSISIFF